MSGRPEDDGVERTSSSSERKGSESAEAPAAGRGSSSEVRGADDPDWPADRPTRQTLGVTHCAAFGNAKSDVRARSSNTRGDQRGS